MSQPANRRAFLRSGGAGLGTLLGAVAAPQLATAEVASQDMQHLQRELELLRSREQLLALQRQCVEALNRQDWQQLAALGAVDTASLPGPCRVPAGAIASVPEITADGRQARLAMPMEVAVSRDIEGNSTAAQMARLQGQRWADLRWQPGCLQLTLRRHDAQWQIASLHYVSDTSTA